MISNENFRKYFSLGVFCIKRIVNKISKFLIKSMEKCQFCGFLKPMFSLFRKACLLYKTSNIALGRFIFAIHDMGIQGVTRFYLGLQGVTGGYKGLQGVTGGYKGLQGVTGGYKG